MLFREIPFLRLVAPLCAGVIAAEAAPGGDTFAWIVVAASAAAMTLLLLRKMYFTDTLFGGILMIFIGAAGYLLYSTNARRLSTFEKQEQTFLLRLSEFPDEKANSRSFRAKIIAAGTDTLRSGVKGSILLYCMNDTLTRDWIPGDRLLIRATPLPVVNNGNPCEFDYRRYMEGQGIKYFGFFSTNGLLEHSSPRRRNLRELSLVTARRMTEAFAAAGLEGEDLGLVTALTIGEKDLLGRDLLTSFSRTGAMHIMAVSGLHVGMISLLISGSSLLHAAKVSPAQGNNYLTVSLGFCIHHGTLTVSPPGYNYVFIPTGRLTAAPSEQQHEYPACFGISPHCGTSGSAVRGWISALLSCGCFHHYIL